MPEHNSSLCVYVSVRVSSIMRVNKLSLIMLSSPALCENITVSDGIKKYAQLPFVRKRPTSNKLVQKQTCKHEYIL